MAPRLSERLQAAIFVGVLVVSIAGVYGLVQWSQPSAVRPSTVLDVRLTVHGIPWVIEYRTDETTNNTAFGILLEAAHHLGFAIEFSVYEIPAGVLVTSINGSVNGQDGRYWLYWVGDVYGTVAADKQGLADGDSVVWRFDRSYRGGPSG